MKLMKLEMPHGTEPREAFCNQKTVTNILQERTGYITL